MRHILFIDYLEDLVIKKDSSLLFAISLAKNGIETYLLFKKDFYYQNDPKMVFDVYSFTGNLFQESAYIENFELGEVTRIQMGIDDVIHMRLDPPFDARYLRYLWMLQGLEKSGARVVNSPSGIMNHNEKLFAYLQKKSCPSYVGESVEAARQFIEVQKSQGYTSLIFKPLDLYQGIGVEKVEINNSRLLDHFFKRVKEYEGPLVIQPFIESIKSGEIRSIYFQGEELGTILKTPPKGGYLANIASGASYKAAKLNPSQQSQCEEISHYLMDHGVDWIAYDILGDYISEVNITCPGLLVEVAEACGLEVVEKLISKNLSLS